MSERLLIERTLSGDKTAFGQLYDKYARLVRAICFDATGDLTAAQDLSQEVFLRAYQKLSALQNRDSFAAWISGIARFAGKEWRRKQLRDRHEFGDMASESMTTPESPPLDEKLNSIHSAMNRLSDNERLALHAFYLCGQSAQEARATLNLSQSGFYKLLDRARENLRGVLTTEQGAG